MNFYNKILLALLLLVLLFSGFVASAQQSVTAKYMDQVIILDGALDETVWETAEEANDFWQYFPADSIKANYATSLKIIYGKETLYIGIRAEAPGNNYVVSSLRRDFGGTTNDNVSLLFDTFKDGTTAFFFGVTPYGVQREGLVSEGGTNFNDNWDIKWKAETQRFEDHYTIEIAIPFSSFKFPEGTDSWRFRAYRWDLQSSEQSSWIRLPQNQPLSSLAYMGELNFEKPLGKSKRLIALIPYVNAITGKDYIFDATETDLKVGGDAKLAIGTGMNLDITLNPDFSNVEVDDIFTNLTRFELFLPEKRQFFIDNSDLFANYGSTRDALPFFSRRIGLARDTLGNLIENRIIGGVRLSGKLNPEWRMGFLNIQTAADPVNEIPSNNNMMLSFQKKVFSRSNLGFFWVNRQTLDDYEFQDPNNRYNRVIGIDYDLASPDNVWRGNFFVHKSFQPDDSKGNLSAQAMLFYDDRNWRFVSDFVYVDEDYKADLGFVPRKDVFKTGHAATRRFYPKSGSISNHSLTFLLVNFWRPNLDFQYADRFLRAGWDVAFKDQSSLSVNGDNNYIFLTNPFDPARRRGATPLPGNLGYTFNRVTAEYQSNPTNLFTYRGNASAGEFFNGESYSVGAIVGLRFQPWANISLAVNYDGIRLPEPYANADIWLLTPRAEITFSKSLFWSTLIQYSNQRDNLGINTRLQWRFAPLSDLFLVYNDNYFVNQFSPSFRSINLKVTYWLNL